METGCIDALFENCLSIMSNMRRRVEEEPLTMENFQQKRNYLKNDINKICQSLNHDDSLSYLKSGELGIVVTRLVTLNQSSLELKMSNVQPPDEYWQLVVLADCYD